MEELQDEAAWYLIAQRSDGKLLGFAHFRFDLDEGIEVLYWYALINLCIENMHEGENIYFYKNETILKNIFF